MEKRLGLGLDALFKSDAIDTIKNIKIEEIILPSWQPRKEFDQASLEELAESIKLHGILQPILLKKKGDSYELIAGERRFRASKIAHITTIPAIILDDDKNTLEISMIENLQRKDLNAVEKAQGFAFLIENLKLNQEELAKRLGISRSMIANYLRINNLDDTIKEKIINGELSFGHAKILASKENASQLANEIVEKKLSVRDIEKKTKKGSENKSDIKRFEEMVMQSFGYKCEIEYHKDSGKIMLFFNNSEEFEEIISKLCL